VRSSVAQRFGAALLLPLLLLGCRDHHTGTAVAPDLADAQAGADLAGVDLAGVDLAGVDLAGVDLTSTPAPTDGAMSVPDLSPGFAIVDDPIPYGSARQSEMAAYSLEHYGVSTAALTPQLIVLHFTAGATYQSAWNTFAADTPNRGELPGTCAHYAVDKNGTIYRLVPEALRCRHTVGLNHLALGIEMVQETADATLASAFAADQAILARTAQSDAALRLVKWLQARYGLGDAAVIGHAMANDSPLFLDLAGWVNDHSDWQAADVATFRTRLDALP
jgi:hypothetical protein